LFAQVSITLWAVQSRFSLFIHDGKQEQHTFAAI